MTKQELVQGINLAINDSIRRYVKRADPGIRYFDKEIIEEKYFDETTISELGQLLQHYKAEQEAPTVKPSKKGK